MISKRISGTILIESGTTCSLRDVSIRCIWPSLLTFFASILRGLECISLIAIFGRGFISFLAAYSSPKGSCSCLSAIICTSSYISSNIFLSAEFTKSGSSLSTSPAFTVMWFFSKGIEPFGNTQTSWRSSTGQRVSINDWGIVTLKEVLKSILSPDSLISAIILLKFCCSKVSSKEIVVSFASGISWYKAVISNQSFNFPNFLPNRYIVYSIFTVSSFSASKIPFGVSNSKSKDISSSL